MQVDVNSTDEVYRLQNRIAQRNHRMCLHYEFCVELEHIEAFANVSTDYRP